MDDAERLYDQFDRAVRLEGQERAALLDDIAQLDPSLHAELVELLRNDATAPPGFLGGPRPSPSPKAKPSTHWDRPLAGFPEKVGGYRLLRVLGQGGMGVVFEAEQSRPARRVALKVIRPRMMQPEVLDRFSAEAEILGRLRHPSIAHVYEAGMDQSAGETWPYIAMELVTGRSLEAYLDARACSTRERLELFARICDAVEHAHQQGVVHRDLKPANIMIVEAGREQDGTPKILDFGVARVAGTEFEHTGQTQAGAIIGTLGYMSPEQLLGRSSEVDARSDLYSLGVVLFRMLTGRLPYDVQDKSLPEVVHLVERDEPTRISEVVDGLSRDIETIVSKALEKDRDRRYASAAELSADVRRHLGDEPIQARAPSLRYRAAKFTRRHRALVGGVAATIAALLVGVVIATSALLQVRRERDAKEEALQISRATTAFLTDMLGAANPRSGGKDVTVAQVLDDAGERIETAYPDKPLVAGRLWRTLGEAYFGLGLPHQAVAVLRRAVAALSEATGSTSLEVLAARRELGRALFEDEDHTYDEAMLEVRAVLEDYREQLEPTDLRIAETLGGMAMIEMFAGSYEKSLEYMEEAKEIADRSRSLPTRLRVDLCALQGNVHMREGTHHEGLVLFKACVEDVMDRLGPDHPDTLDLLEGMALTYRNLGQLEDAARVFRRVWETSKRVMGPASSETLQTANFLGRVLADQDRIDDALEVVAEARRADEAKRGYVQGYLDFAYGRILAKAERWTDAEAAFRRSLKRIEIMGATGSYSYFVTTLELAKALLPSKKYGEAERRLRRILKDMNSAAFDHLKDEANLLVSQAMVLQGHRDIALSWLQGLPEPKSKDRKAALRAAIQDLRPGARPAVRSPRR
ncbi:MAG: serine/threonine-protein kinase [Myxococcota bacterium]